MKAILLIAALMAGFILVLFNLARFIAGQPSIPQVLLLIVPAFLAGAALGAALGLRWSRASWPAAVWGSLLSALVVLIYLWFFGGEFSPGIPGDYPGAIWDGIRSALVYLVIVTAGIFLLPLFDTYVRRQGPAPTRWKVTVAALALALVAAAVDLFFMGQGQFGLVTLVIGSAAALLLAGLALLLSVVRVPVAGAWAGGLGLLSWFFVLILWTAAGFPWFP